jgi:hypothetical protein
MRLEAAYDVSSFIHVAESDSLRPLVREITIDPWVGPDLNYHANESIFPPQGFMRALPSLRLFTGLKTLNLRFNEWCANEEAPHYDGVISIEENSDFRYFVLDTVFSCLAGTWAAGIHALQEGRLVSYGLEDSQESRLVSYGLDEMAAVEDETEDYASGPSGTGAIELNALTISNLADYDDQRLTSSDTFKRVISSKHLTELKLLVTMAQDESSTPEEGLALAEKYEFFETLPRTWLSPPIAQNLRVLSLFSRDYWGWNPKMDFRTVNPGTGPNSGFPNLRVLALGHYVFSHEWHIDWVASLGRQNGRGGLEELYLDDCPILWYAHAPPMDESKTTCKSVSGEHMEFSHAGYPRKDIMVGMGWPGSGIEWEAVHDSYGLRWHHVLDRWRESMAGLKVFKMGHGSEDFQLYADAAWPGARSKPDISLKYNNVYQGAADDRELKLRQEPCKHTNFLNYDCPSPPRDSSLGLKRNSVYRNGVGLQHEREHILQYVHFDIGLGPQWQEFEESLELMMEQGMEAYKIGRQLDDEAYDRFMEAHRRVSLSGKAQK